MLEIKTPEQIQGLLESLTLSDKERYKLNVKLANLTRRFFRKQIAQQRDIYGVKYKRRKKPANTFTNSGKHVKANNMFMGLSRMLQTQVSKDSLRVGLTGMSGIIARIHNEGETVSYTRRINGWFNKETNRWEGGIKSKGFYRMPKRTLIGWSDTLEQQIANEILTSMEPKT